jgi:ribosome-associated protein
MENKKKPTTKLEARGFENEFIFNTSKSSGPGGQHVNKTETRVELRFDVENSALLSFSEKYLVKSKLDNKINAEGFLVFAVQDSRSQAKNKELAIQRFFELLKPALKKNKKRIRTKPSKNQVEKRLENKKKRAEIKKFRKRVRE